MTASWHFVLVVIIIAVIIFAIASIWIFLIIDFDHQILDLPDNL